MPIYEYRCENGHHFDVMQRMSDDPVQTCQECGAPVQRVLHPVAVHFKGKGFYNTDYGTKKRQRELKNAAEGGDSSSSTDSGSSSDSGSSGDKGGDAGGSSGGSEKSPAKDSGSGSGGSSSGSGSGSDSGSAKKGSAAAS